MRADGLNGFATLLLSTATLLACNADAPNEVPTDATPHSSEHVVERPQVPNPTSVQIPFQQNAGQWPGDVAFMAECPAETLWITRDGSLVHSLPTARLDPDRQLAASADRSQQPMAHQPSETRWSVVERFANAGHAHPQGLERSAANASYYLGADPSRWAPHVSTFAAIDLGEMWPGIKVTLTAREQHIEKVFHVASRANPAGIRLTLNGIAAPLRVDHNGALLISGANGAVRLTRPFAYQERNDGTRESVAVEYVAENNSYTFALGAYDPARELIIDPILQSTFVGGNNNEALLPYAVVDNRGEIVVATYTFSNNYPGTGGGVQSNVGGGYDIAVSRFNRTLTQLLRSTYLGGGGDQFVNTILVDRSSGDLLLLGSSGSADYPGTSGSAQSTFGGSSDIVVSRLDPTLALLRGSTFLGGSNSDFGIDATLDGAGDLIVFGYSVSDDYPGTTSGAQPTRAGGQDFVLSRLNGALTTLRQSTYLGGTANEVPGSSSGQVRFGTVLVDRGGNIVVASRTGSTDYPGTTGGAQPTSTIGGAVVSRLNPALTLLVQSTFVGAETRFNAVGMALTNDDDLVIVGDITFSGPSLPNTNGAAQPTFAGGNVDGVVIRLSGSLTSIVRSTYLGGPNNDQICGVSIASDGDILVSGHSRVSMYPGTVGGALSSGSQGGDTVVSRLDPTLSTLEQSTYLLQQSNAFGASLVSFVDNDEIVVLSLTDQTSVPGIAGGAQTANAGGIDIVVTRVTSDLRGCNDNRGCQTESAAPILTGRPICEVSSGQCLACVADSDCEDGNLCTANVCNLGDHTCITTALSSGAICRSAAADCDLAELCPGAGLACPADAFRDAAFVCRGSAGVCDEAETCTGTTSACPVDAFRASGTTCGNGFCDGANVCAECVDDSQCADSNPCTRDQCASQTCSHSIEPVGTSCGNNLRCNDRGECAGCSLASQCSDTIECTDDICDVNGVCHNDAFLTRTPCNSGQGVCTTALPPRCVGCLVDSDCPPNTHCENTSCVARTGLNPNGDEDADTLTNADECPTLMNCPDSDSDGLPDYDDPDDDNDGIVTRIERFDSMRFGNDVDLDGRVNWLDSDADSDGLRDGIDGRAPNQEGRPSYLDPNAPFRTGGLSGGGGCSVQYRQRSTSVGAWMSIFLLAIFRGRRRKFYP